MVATTKTLLELFTMQQTRGEPGVRLNFHSELLDAITLTKQPYHYCAMTGNSALAVLLSLRQVPLSRPITVASFAACGPSGATPWKKPLTVSPKEVALLAGHAETAAVLRNLEHRVPLHWTRKRHHLFPADFRKKVRPLVEALLASPFFVALPGPARTYIMDDILTALARRNVWGMLDDRVWGEQWSEMLDPELVQIVEQLDQAHSGRHKGWRHRLLQLGMGAAVMFTARKLGVDWVGATAFAVGAPASLPALVALCLATHLPGQQS